MYIIMVSMLTVHKSHYLASKPSSRFISLYAVGLHFKLFQKRNNHEIGQVPAFISTRTHQLSNPVTTAIELLGNTAEKGSVLI